jgi:metal-responsive CopG/Arc/MetJ family transcriptional regulator
MVTISLKLPDDLLETSGAHAERLNVSRAEYIRRAIARMNDDMAAHARAQQLARASRKVRSDSMRINAEFAAVERDIE